MDKKSIYKKLFEPGAIGKLEIKNRIVMTPMATQYANIDGSYSRRQVDYYSKRAEGGVGLILTEATFTEKEISLPADILAPYLDSPHKVPAASDLVEAVHDYGAKIGIQLGPGPGRNMLGGSAERVPISASPVPSFFDPNLICRELSTEEIRQLAKAYGLAAERALLAGFDMIEVHAHVGYLIDQFMTPIWNKRNDEYGGDLAGRMKFAVDLIDETRKSVGKDVPISFRYSGEHLIENGRTLEESKDIARHLEEAGIDVLHIDVGLYESLAWNSPTTYEPEGCLVYLAEAIKEVVNIPVITVGSINSPEIAEQILEENRADFIGMGRSFLADPDWPNKVKEGRSEDIMPCIRCNERCLGHIFALKPISCTVNPTVGKERYYKIRPADKIKKIVVIGGGPAGMEAARVAALKGHNVVLYEKETQLGGQLLAASEPPSFKGPIKNLIKHLEMQLNKAGVKVEMGKEVTLDFITRQKPDLVIAATGATALIPEIPGVENEKVITAVDLHMGKKTPGKELIVAGGGLAGCEAALALAMEGKKVTIVEMLPEIAVSVNEAARQGLLEHINKQKGIVVLTNTRIEKFTDEGLEVIDNEGNKKNLKADHIILAMGAKSENKLIEKLADTDIEFYTAGDCIKPRKIGDAMHDGFFAGWRT